MAEKINLQQKIQAYRQSNPKLKKLSDNQVLSIMVKSGAITLTAEQKQSIFASSKQKDNNTGLQVEKTTKANPKKTIYLQSGRKVVYSRLADGRTVMQYFGADGTPIKPDYFKKVEGQISIAANGSSYTVTKNGKKRTLKAKNPTQGAVDQNLARLNNEEKRLNKTKKEQGWIGKGWDWVKNKTGIGDGSDKAQQQINAEKKLLNQVKIGKISKKDFKNATGVEYTKENLEKFKRGELSQASTKINGYKEGQEMAADVVGDMVSGIAAVTIYTAAVAAAPFTGGASIAIGIAAATASGALIKAGVKALDTVGTDKKYTMKDFEHDLVTGAFSGALAPITGGFGGAVGKTVATKLGIQAVKQVGKEVAEEVVETGVKQGLKTALTNPAGYEYVGGTLLKRGTAMAAEMATDGALGGAIDGGFRAGLDNNWDTEAMLDGAVEGGIGGAIMSPIIGGGFKTMGKGAQKVFGKDNVKVDANGNKVADEEPTVTDVQGTKEAGAKFQTDVADKNSSPSFGEKFDNFIKNSKQKIQYLNDYQKFARVVLSSKSKGFWIPKLLNEKPGETISARLKIYDKLMKYKDRTVTEDALRVAELTNANNISVIETLVDDKQFVEYASHSGVRNELWEIVSSLDSVNMPLAEKLAKDNDFPSYLIPEVLVHNSLPDVLRMSAKNYELPDYSKIRNDPIIKRYNKDIENLIKTIDLLKQNRDCTTDLFIEVAQALNGDNLALTDILFSIKDLPKHEIPRILRVTTKDTFDFAKRLCTDEKLNFPKDKIADIIRTTDEDILAFAERLCTDEKLNFPKDKIADIVRITNKDNKDYAINLCTNYKKYGINQKHIVMLIKNKNNVSIEQYQQLLAQINKEELATWTENDIVIGCQLSGLIGKQNINEIPLSQKRSILKVLVSCNTNLFGITDKLKGKAVLIPKNQEEYCELLPSLVRSLGIATNKLSAEQITHTNTATQNLSKSLAKLSDSDFAKLSISQEYSREDFINTVLEKTKNLPETERQKVFDYYGFELLKNDTNKTGCTLYGYPVNLNNGHKLAEINDVNTKAVVESLRNDVVRFSKNNRIKCENPQVEQFLNEIVEVLPEIRTMIGKAQHGNNGTRGAHDYDVMKHSLKVMQKISQDPKFAKLNESDKKVMMLASLMHDITKLEGHPDGMHAENGAFDVFFIAKKFNLTPEEETKLYKICKYHEWLNFVNTSKSESELTKRLQSVAFDLQQDNLVDMAEIFTHADLRAVKADDSFHDTKVGKSRVDFNGNVRSFGESADIYVARIKEYQKELQKSQPILPVTKFPQASRMKQAITTVNADGSTNLKGVYQDKDGVVVIKFNEMTDESWEAIGFPKGTSAKGVKAKGLNNKGAETDVETGNIHFFVHGLEYSNQLAKFDAFSLVDSDALLSVSYAERPESKYRFFRTQGVLLDIPTK